MCVVKIILGKPFNHPSGRSIEPPLNSTANLSSSNGTGCCFFGEVSDEEIGLLGGKKYENRTQGGEMCTHRGLYEACRNRYQQKEQQIYLSRDTLILQHMLSG